MYNFKKDNIMSGDELYINNDDVELSYKTPDGKNIIFAYNHPDLVIFDFEIVRKANIINSTNLGRIYQVNFTNGFILEDNMEVTYTNGYDYNSIDIYGTNLIYNINSEFLENIKFINLTDKIYIYKKNGLCV